MKKTIVLLLTFICLLSFSAYAEIISSETTLTVIEDTSMLDISYTGYLGSNIVAEGTFSRVGYFSIINLMGGYKLNIGSGAYYNDATLLFLAGTRLTELNTGLLLSADFKTFLNNKVFIHDTIEFVSWKENAASVLTNKFLIGYKTGKYISIKGGITWIQVDGDNYFGPTFGVEANI